MEYYIFSTEEDAFEKNAAIYDLCSPAARSERITLYAYNVFTNGTYFAMAYDGWCDAQGLLAGLTPETEEEIINKGYDLENPIVNYKLN